ncbi:hypothetical protein ANO14919_122180 [Xylariales sp. No.14919]|nr:hypothetical protein ANO14919_122180 [Xylariales sp. No.14919]
MENTPPYFPGQGPQPLPDWREIKVALPTSESQEQVDYHDSCFFRQLENLLSFSGNARRFDRSRPAAREYMSRHISLLKGHGYRGVVVDLPANGPLTGFAVAAAGI